MHSLIAFIPSAGLLMQRYGLLLDHLSHTPAPGDGFLIAGVSETAPRCVLAHVAKILFFPAVPVVNLERCAVGGVPRG